MVWRSLPGWHPSSLRGFALSAIALASLAILLFSTGSAMAAPPSWDYSFPAGGGVGETVEVTATGKFARWPPAFWVDRAGLTIEAAEKKGVFKVAVSPEAAPGVYWLRIVDAEGVSRPRPFVVARAANVLEKEPNNAVKDAQEINTDNAFNAVVVNGRLNKAGDVDAYRVPLKAGQTLVASLLANRVLESPMDGVLQLCSESGFVLAQNDETRGYDPQIVFTAPADGRFIVRVFAFPTATNSSIAFSGNAKYVYRLTLTTGGFLDHALPLAVGRETPTKLTVFGWNVAAGAEVEVEALAIETERAEKDSGLVAHHESTNGLELPRTEFPLLVAAEENSRENPQDVTLPVLVSGRIETAGDVDAFRFTLAKGQKVSFEAAAWRLGFPLDPHLRLFDPQGASVAEVDDTNRKRDAVLNYTAKTAGAHTLQIRDLHRNGGFRYVYRLSMRETRPDFSLTLEADAFVVKQGQTIEIPVKIERQNGFSDEIEITAVGLPEGIEAPPVLSPAKGETAKAVKLKITAKKITAGNAPYSGVFQIVGRPVKKKGEQKEDADKKELKHVAGFTLAGSRLPFKAPWLTVTAAESAKK